jgi:O-antigen biosynthesis protein
MNIVILSSLPWSFLRQRPQHIASKLAKKGHNILFFENPEFISSFSVLQQKIKEKQLYEIKKVEENIWTVKLYLPHFMGRFASVKDEFCRLSFRYCLRKLNFHPDVAVFYTLHYYSLLKTLKSMNTKITFEFVDDITSFQEFAFDNYVRMEIDLIKSSSVCFATSQLLCGKVLKYNPNCVYLPNAMDFEHFNSAAKTTKIIPEDLSNLKHPVIGFIGALFEWINVDLICKIAKNHPEYSILIVGPVNFGKNQLETCSNIFMVGTKPYESLPSYLSNIDVCLIPFKMNSITLHSNPIKMYEYLAAGKPVVSTALPEIINNASGIVYIGKDEEDYIKMVEAAAKEVECKDEFAIAKRINFARENSWDNRVEVVEQNLKKVIAR